MYITDEKVTEYINKFYMPLNIKLDKLRKNVKKIIFLLYLEKPSLFYKFLLG